MTADASTPTHDRQPGEIQSSSTRPDNALVAVSGGLDPVTSEAARHPSGCLAADGDHQSEAKPVAIELEPGQVEKIVRHASEAETFSVLHLGLDGVRTMSDAAEKKLEHAGLSRSLLCGLMMFAALPADGSYIGNADLSRSLDMNQTTAYRYISTLVAAGLAERDSATRRYRRTR
ncbi:MAG TPA: helix-turn-helix domain-containing protein [Solirubrobacteraceae bacterium]|nr:helix-turn-helix domain-containing protein [Solirubrobacteraceae bacterium]